VGKGFGLYSLIHSIVKYLFRPNLLLNEFMLFREPTLTTYCGTLFQCAIVEFSSAVNVIFVVLMIRSL